MAFIPAPNTALVQVTATMASEPVENTFHFRLPTAPGVVDLQDLSDSVQAYWTTHGPALLPNVLTLNKVIVTDVATQVSPEVETSFAPGTNGILFGQALPNINSKWVQFNTPYRGRSARGGIHWMGLTEDYVVSNTIAAGLLTSIDLFCTNFFSTIQSGTGWIACVTSYRNNGFPRPVAVNYDINEVSFANDSVGSMVGRKV